MNHLLVGHVHYIMSAPAPISQRRKRQKLWSEVFDQINITDEQKEGIVAHFIESITPTEFLKGSDSFCKAFCIGSSVEGLEN